MPKSVEGSELEIIANGGYHLCCPLESWEVVKEGKLSCSPLDDFDIILGNEFFVLAKAIPMPFLGRMLIMDESQPCFVKVVRKVLPPPHKGSKDGVLSVAQAWFEKRRYYILGSLERSQ